MFNCELKITDINELFLLAEHGTTGTDYQTRYPDDPVAQTKYILEDINNFLKSSGYTKDDIIGIEFTTMTKDVAPDKYDAIFG